MSNILTELRSNLENIEFYKTFGKVTSISGMLLTAKGISSAISIGGRCLVHGKRGKILAEVVGIENEECLLLPFGSWDGVSSNCTVETANYFDFISPNHTWIGRVINSLGEPLDELGLSLIHI